MYVGILALQGDFAEHLLIVRSLGHNASEVRTVADIEPVTHLIIPGGESTVIAKFLEETGIGEWIKAKVADGTLAVFGTCAGAILLATEATGKNAPQTLGLLDITIDRNAYGTQRDSFDAELTVSGIEKPIVAAFIRAPKITRIGSNVEVLAVHDTNPVLVRLKRVLAATFHPEVRADMALHQFFLSL